MKNLFLSASVAMLFLGLTSCSTNETQDFDELAAKENLFKTYKVQKDVNGRYSVDYTVKSNAEAETVSVGNTKDIYLYAGEIKGNKVHSEGLTLDNNQLGVNFVEDSGSKTSFIVEDENIVLAKGQKNNQFLQEYSLVKNEDGTFQLDFKVKEGVNVNFVYNEKDGAYEINLREGKSNNVNFSKTFVKDANDLKIDFINHTQDLARGQEVSRPKRPRVIVVS